MVSLGGIELKQAMGVGTNRWGDETADALGVLRAALDAGVTLIDTAEMYSGSEEAVGRAVREDGRSAIIATKYFPLPFHFNFRMCLTSHLDKSLKRLGMDQVDLLYIHAPTSCRPISAQADALASVVQAGKCKSVGVSNFSEEQMREMHAALAQHGIPLAANQVEFSLLRNSPMNNGLLAACKELNVALVAWCPFGDGRLGCSAEEREQLPDDVKACADVVAKIAEKRQKTITQVALNWCISKGAIPLAGTRKSEHMTSNAGALGWQLTDEEIAELDTVAVDDAGTMSTHKGFAGRILSKLMQSG